MITLLARPLVTVVLLTAATCASAQNSFNFEYPDPGADIPANVDEAVKIRWRRAGNPVVGGRVRLETTLGVVQVEEVNTNSSGLATFSIKSSVTGEATLIASTPDATPIATASIAVNFVDDQAAATAKPFGEFAERSAETGQLEMWIFNDRIGFRGSPGVDTGAVAQIAANENLTQLTPLADNIFVLKVPSIPANVDATIFLRSLARRLQLAYAEVEKAGRVARIVESTQWLIIPDQIIAKFPLTQDDSANIDLIGEFTPLEVTRAPLDLARYLITLPVTSDPADPNLADEDALDVSARLSENRTQVVYAEPNYIIPFDLRQSAPWTDQHFSFQWHHENDGTYATSDADVDSRGAWAYSWGSDDVTIAIVDRGFDINHPDLVDNLLCEPGEWCHAQVKRVVDVYDMDNTDLLSSSTHHPWFAHGTRVAGVAAERGGNTIGYTGGCPHCNLMLIRTEQDADSVAAAYDHAILREVDVISNSWGIGIGDSSVEPIKSILDRIDTAVNAGITVTFAMPNAEVNLCVDSPPDISYLPNVIAVSGVNDFDLRSSYPNEALGFGSCMDVVAPTRGGVRGIRTTSVSKNAAGVAESTYWYNFGGTSSATPLVAGTIGLLRSLDNQLNPTQIQRILQDTADRVDPQHADYSPESGFSRPYGESTYGYGRVNSMEAARLVAPTIDDITDENFLPGLGGKDLLLRDHEYDWGNTEKASNVIFNSPREEYTRDRSVDIKIDVEPFQLGVSATGLYDPQQFVNLQSETAKPGQRSRVYVRLRNRGPYSIDEALIKLHVAIVKDAFPDLPANFWNQFPADPTPGAWTPLPRMDLTNVLYSGASVAGCPDRNVPDCHPLANPPDDKAQILMFPVSAMDWNPDEGEQPAFLAIAHSDDDPVLAKTASPPAVDFLSVATAVTQDNNITVLLSALDFQCNTRTQIIVIVFIFLVTVLVVYTIWRWINGRPVKITIYLTIVIAVTIVIVIIIQEPECFAFPDYAIEEGPKLQNR